MNRHFKYILIIFLTAFIGIGASSKEVEDDAKKDHPLLSRLPGYQVDEKSDDYDVLIIEEKDVAGKLPNAKFPMRLEGYITKIEYAKREGLSNTQYGIYKNYEAAIIKLGGRQLNQGFEKTSDGIEKKYQIFEIPDQKNIPKTTILLLTTPYKTYELTIIKSTALVEKVKVGGLLREIETQGFATVHVNFDDNKSDLKKDATEVILQIVELLKQNPTLALSIEGHTDNVGTPESNKKLSLDRAESVKKAVVGHGISATRMSSKGFGAEAPVADNRSDAGKAQNRRVELIKVK